MSYANIITNKSYNNINIFASFSIVTAPIVPISVDGLLYNQNTGEYLYDDITGASIKW